MTPLRVFDLKGRPVELGRSLGSGGEGAVFEIRNAPGRVAKIYHKELTKEHSDKVWAMTRLRTEAIARIAAWPLEPLLSSSNRVSGFSMPEALGKPIHLLYSPKSRVTEFPGASWPFLVRTAANLARSFLVVHNSGHLVGDVNHGNSLVSEAATVTLIDSDSFQIADGSRIYLCGVGVATHLAPELQGCDLRQLVRTQSHDCFSLAILIFQILFMGRHPFSGRYLGVGEMPIEKAIREFRFAYGDSATARQMQPPPNTPPLATASLDIASLFERAFSNKSAQGWRPKASEWVEALAALERNSKACARRSSHHFPAQLASCPWCTIEAQTGVLLFAPPLPPAFGTASTFDVEIVWSAIRAVDHPAPFVSPGAALQPSPSQKALEWRSAIRVREARLLGALGLASLIVFVFDGCYSWAIAVLAVTAAWTWLAEFKRETRAKAQSVLDDAKIHLQRVESEWLREASDDRFKAKLQELESYHKEYKNLGSVRQRELGRLQASLRESQLGRFLDRYRIDRARIDGIGPGRTAALQSFAIETAADISLNNVMKVPGFGPSLAHRLVAWRSSLEVRFVFNPSKGVDPRDIQALDLKLAARKNDLQRALRDGVGLLHRVRQEIEARRQALYPHLKAAHCAVAQAQSDLDQL